ncbi:MAG TPA: hypothetical protein VJ672_02245 [Gemmatimonadaceae bacterium]|nr:hypothetical protein [Gemmatimonadaceae bacterium]
MTSVVLGCCGLALALLGTSRYGIGNSSDALAYISAAQSLRNGNGLQLYNGQPYLGWPPIYPIVVAAVSTLGIGAAAAARVVNALVFGLLISVAVLWSNRLRMPLIASTVVGLFVLFAVPMLDLWRMAYSELLFVATIVGFLWLMTRWQETGRFSYLVFAALCAGAAILTRYAGLATLLTGGLLIVLDASRRWPRRFLYALVFAALTLLTTVPWIIRNATVAGAPTGIDPVRSPESVGQVIVMTIDVVGSWFAPSRVPAIVRQVFAALALIAPVLVLTIAAFSGRRSNRVASTANDHASIMSLSAWVVTYVVFLVTSRSITFIDSDHSRLTAPIYIPLILVIAWALVSAARNTVSVQSRRLHAATLFAALVVLLWPIRFTIGATERLVANGAGGYATTRWQSSEVLRYLRSNPIRQPVFSNEPHAVHAIARLDSVYSLPDHDHVMSPISADSALRRLRASLSGDSYVVLFNRPELARNVYSEGEVAAVLGATPVARFSDGSVYRVSRSRGMTDQDGRAVQ